MKSLTQGPPGTDRRPLRSCSGCVAAVCLRAFGDGFASAALCLTCTAIVRHADRTAQWLIVLCLLGFLQREQAAASWSASC